jgi:hypothetical protein
MVEVVCISDKNRPNQIPESDWVKQGDIYHITHVSIQVNHLEHGIPIMGCDIYEKPLCLEKHNPYECWRLSRFGVDEKNLLALIELIENCYGLPKDEINDIIEQSQLQYL